MRILLYSNAPWQNSGYGRVTKELAIRFRELGHDIAIASTGLVGNAINWNGFTVYPTWRHPMGVDTIGAYSRHFMADVVLTLYDIWAFPPDIGKAIGAPWIAYTPIDGDPVPEAITGRLTAQRTEPMWTVAMSKYGQEELGKAGVDSEYIPLGIDCDVFKPGDKAEARAALGIQQDRFMVTMVAANRGYPPRKSWIECLTAFAHFNKEHPNSFLYAHTTATPLVAQGVRLDRLAAQLGITGKVVFPDECELAVGVPDEQMAQIYQASDVLLSPSMGEGFGLPIVEAQACGCPVITQWCSSMPELTREGSCILPLVKTWIPQLDYYWSQAHTGNIIDALMMVKETGGGLWTCTSPTAEMEEYHWPNVITNHWQPFLERVEAALW